MLHKSQQQDVTKTVISINMSFRTTVKDLPNMVSEYRAGDLSPAE